MFYLMKSELISTDRITVLDAVDRPLSKVPDDRDRRSIEQFGIRQPLVGVRDGERILLAKGLRRLRIAKSLGMGKVPIVLEDAPKGFTPADYVRELRLTLQEHRQDLFPSQKCSLIMELKKRFGMNNKQVAAYRGIDPDSVTNQLAIANYIRPVVEALDSGRLTMQAARVFDGMTEEGQEEVWRRHGADLSVLPGGGMHKSIRAEYHPDKFAHFYRQPELVASRLSRKSGKRRTKGRSALTSNEKRRLQSSLEMKELEIREGTEEYKAMKTDCVSAAPIVAAIRRSDNLRGFVREETMAELERFAEVY